MTYEILGWAAALNKTGDATGRCHLIITVPSKKFPGEKIGRPACRSMIPVSGQVHKNPPEYSPHRCILCEKSEAKIKRLQYIEQRNADRELVQKCNQQKLRRWKCGLKSSSGSTSPDVIFATTDTEEEAKAYMAARMRLNFGVIPHRLTQEVGWWIEMRDLKDDSIKR
jgi:hypothetical protein